MPDAKMKPSDDKPKGDKKGKDDNKKEEEVKAPPPPPPTPEAEIKSNLSLIERAVSTLEPRFTNRVLRTLTALRKRINDTVLRNAVEGAFPKGEHVFSSLMVQCG